MKRVVSGINCNITTLDHLNMDKSYGVKGTCGLYQAHYVVGSGVSGNSYCFLPLFKTDGWLSGTHRTLRGLLEDTINSGFEVFEFDNVKEFAEWILKNS